MFDISGRYRELRSLRFSGYGRESIDLIQRLSWNFEMKYWDTNLGDIPIQFALCIIRKNNFNSSCTVEQINETSKYPLKLFLIDNKTKGAGIEESSTFYWFRDSSDYILSRNIIIVHKKHVCRCLLCEKF